MAETDKNYWMKKGETPDQYAERVGVYRNSKTDTKTEAPSGDSGISALVAQLQKSMSSQAKAINSSTTNIEKRINEAITQTKTGTEAETARIESEFGRAIGYAEDQGKTNLQTFRESQSGFGTQMVALRELVKTTDKTLADLEQRKQELILQNNSAGASRIADLELKALEYQEESRQKVFNNLLSMSNFGLSVSQFEEGKRQFGIEQDFAQKQLDTQTRQKMAEIAAAYGVQLAEGDTIDDVINRVAPIASQKTQLELEALRKDIAYKNASINKILTGESDEQPFDSETAEVLARAALTGDTFFIESLKTNEQKRTVYEAINRQKDSDAKNLKMIAQQSRNEAEFMENANFYYGSINYPVDQATIAGVIATHDFKQNKINRPLSREDIVKTYGGGTGFGF